MKSLIAMLSLSLCTLGALRLGFAENAAPATRAAKEACCAKADGCCAQDAKGCAGCRLTDKPEKGGACAKDANSACAKGCAKDGKEAVKGADGKPAAAECAMGCACCCSGKEGCAKPGEGKADCKKACETKPSTST